MATASEIIETIRSLGEDLTPEDALRAFRETCVHLASSAVKTCPASYDSSTKFVFADGSVLELDNPRQAAFPAAISPIALAIEACGRIERGEGKSDDR